MFDLSARFIPWLARAYNEKQELVDEATEQSVIKSAIEYPAYGQHRTSNELRKKACLSLEVVFVQFGYDIMLWLN